MNNIKNFLKNLKPIKYVTLLQKYNKLLVDYDVLKNAVKNELFKEMLSKIATPETETRLRKENKKLQQKIRTLTEIIKEGK